MTSDEAVPAAASAAAARLPLVLRSASSCESFHGPRPLPVSAAAVRPLHRRGGDPELAVLVLGGGSRTRCERLRPPRSGQWRRRRGRVRRRRRAHVSEAVERRRGAAAVLLLLREANSPMRESERVAARQRAAPSSLEGGGDSYRRISRRRRQRPLILAPPPSAPRLRSWTLTMSTSSVAVVEQATKFPTQQQRPNAN